MRLVIGAAGGTKITSGVAIGMLLNLWSGYNIKETVDARRLHHQVSSRERYKLLNEKVILIENHVRERCIIAIKPIFKIL